VVLSALVLAATASAATAVEALTPGAQTLSLRGGTGLAILGLRGATLGRMTSGRLLFRKPSWSSARLVVYGADYRRRLANGWRLYGGRYLWYRVYTGVWRLRLRGSGITLSAAGRGWFALAGTRGTYSKAGRAYRRWPRTLAYFRLGT
jgi:hypothetical protein